MAQRLSLAERQDLANDPRLQNPQIKAQVFAKLDPADQQWITDANAQPHAPNAPQALTDALKGAAGGAWDYTKRHPSEVGAMAGATAAVPLTGGASLIPAALAALLGGAGGAALGNTASAAFDPNSPAPHTSGGVLKDMGVQGASMAAGEGIGRGVIGGIKGGANLLMNEAVPADIAKNFPGVNLGDTLNRYAINPTTRGGASRARVLRRDAASTTSQLVNDATANGVPGITRRDVSPYMGASTKQAADEAKAGVTGGADAIRSRTDQLFDAQFPYPDIPLSDAPAVTRTLQKEGRVVRKAVNAGQKPTDIGAMAADDLANGVRRTTADRVPGYDAANANTQALIAATQAAEKMSKMPVRLGGWPSRIASGGIAAGGAASGDPIAGLAAAAIPLAIGTPHIAAPVAINLYRTGKLPWTLLTKMVAPEVLQQMGVTEQR